MGSGHHEAPTGRGEGKESNKYIRTHNTFNIIIKAVVVMSPRNAPETFPAPSVIRRAQAIQNLPSIENIDNQRWMEELLTPQQRELINDPDIDLSPENAPISAAGIYFEFHGYVQRGDLGTDHPFEGWTCASNRIGQIPMGAFVHNLAVGPPIGVHAESLGLYGGRRFEFNVHATTSDLVSRWTMYDHIKRLLTDKATHESFDSTVTLFYVSGGVYSTREDAIMYMGYHETNYADNAHARVQ